MRAFAVRSFGEAPAVSELPTPADPGAIGIRVTYAGVNPIDSKLVERLTAASTFPFVIGIDFAGVVERSPDGTSDFRTGDRIFGMARTHGSYAEHTAVAAGAKAEPLARIPDGVTDEQAAALPIAGITALGALELLGVAPKQSVVVFGATGGVGGYAVEMARARGARVIAIVRGDVDEARRLGAEEVYDSTAGDVVAAIHAAHPDGVDGMVDLINGAEPIRRNAEIIKPGGRLVSTVYSADIPWFAARRITAYNISSTQSPQSSPEGLSEVARMLAAGTITARIGAVVPLDGVAKLLDTVRAGGLHGKAVIRM